MEMEFMAEFTQGMSRDRARQIIRGKRTKRQRPCSPFGLSSSNTSGNNNNTSNAADGDCLIDNNNYDHSSEISTEEEQDMANCLIMLAQSVSHPPAVKEQEEEKSDQILRQKTEKLSSRRFTEMTAMTTTTGGGGKIGIYVYECKTCNRTFPSFQALGGHRASHKKPKVVSVEEKKSDSVNIPIPPPLTEYSEENQHKFVVVEDEENIKASVATIIRKSPSPSSGNFMIQTGIINNNIKGKVHECSICGSEFLSGQALGGHMRKHRPIPPSINRSVGISMNTDDSTTDHHNHNNHVADEKSPGGSCGGMLSLDLNLPPPEAVDDDVVQSKFQFASKPSQQHLVFSAPALVDCHY
ncbi:hypothetical protein OSB04_009312 [Centaurea solstitialis]|uniref:C2H2-type domain-containing protein n=1 Tax=Centaurea solstitialis TaxID=347529 RepID=A0AA38T5F4_9ASTR|nr:hypothetical protein OSB04_009312 [Centaurea solstitialis]